MISDKYTLKQYLKADAKLYPKVSSGILSRIKNRLVTNPQNTQYRIYSYIINLRYAEYHENNSILKKKTSLYTIWHTIHMIWYYYKLRKLSYQTGIQIAPNSFGKGLQIGITVL